MAVWLHLHKPSLRPRRNNRFPPKGQKSSRPGLSKSKNLSTMRRHKNRSVQIKHRVTTIPPKIIRFYKDPTYINLIINILATCLYLFTIWILISKIPTTEALMDSPQPKYEITPTFGFSQLGYTHETNHYYFLATEIDLSTIFDLILELETKLNTTNTEIHNSGRQKMDTTTIQIIKRRLTDFYESAGTRQKRDTNLWKKVQSYVPMATQITARLLNSLTEGTMQNQLSAILTDSTQLLTKKVATGLRQTLTKMTAEVPASASLERNQSLTATYPFLKNQIVNLRTLSLTYTSAMLQLRNRKFPITLFSKQYIKTLYEKILDQLYTKGAKPISRTKDFLLECFSTLYKKPDSKNLLIITQIPYTKGEELRIYKYNENPVNIYSHYHIKITPFSEETILLVNPTSKKFKVVNKDLINKCTPYGRQYFCPQITSLQTLPDTTCLYDLFLSRQSVAQTCNIKIFESKYLFRQLEINKYQIYSNEPLLLQTKCTNDTKHSIIKGQQIITLNNTCNMITSSKFHLYFNEIIKNEPIIMTHSSIFYRLQKQVHSYLENPIIVELLTTLSPETISLSKLEMINKADDILQDFNLTTIYPLVFSIIAFLIAIIKPSTIAINKLRECNLKNPCKKNRQRHTLNFFLTHTQNEPSAPPNSECTPALEQQPPRPQTMAQQFLHGN